MKLNIGSGSKRYTGFINIDSDAGSEPDYALNLEVDRLPFEDGSVSEVKAYHILEHLGDGFFHCVKELYRACKHGALIDVRVPHPRHDTFLIDPTHRRPILPDTLAMFSKKRNDRDRELGGSETPLGYIYDVDLEVVKVDYVLDQYFQQAFSELTEQQCQHIVRTCNNAILESQIMMMVVKT